MSIRNLPQAPALQRPKNFQWDAPSDVLARWAEQPLAATDGADATTITIYDVIGEDWWSGGGFTDIKMAAILRSIGEKDVTVNINSPGGDMFAGIAIYNMLAQHKGAVTVNVMGLAASAASIIAMAGDTINMATGSFMMIHNAWGVVVGNKLDMRAAADTFDGFDGALADIYEARTGMKRAEIVALMDSETWMGAGDAVKRGFADATIAADSSANASASVDSGIMARRQLDTILARNGVPRSERRRMLREATGTHDAAETSNATQDAGALMASLTRQAAIITA